MNNSIKPSLLAVRAVGAYFGIQIWWNVTWLCLGIAIALIALCAWLISLSGWWWILALFVGMALSVAAVILIVFRALLNYVTPAQTGPQKQAVKDFATKLQFVQELTQTPKIVLLFRVVKSVAAPSSDAYLEHIFESKRLHRDFERIIGLF